MKLFVVACLLACIAVVSANDASKEDRELTKKHGQCPRGQKPTADGLRCRLLGRWRQVGRDIEGEEGEELTGSRAIISKNGNFLVVDGNINDDGGEDAGRVQIYRRSRRAAGGWIKVGQDIVGMIEDGRLGADVDISSNGQIVAIGGSGIVQVFRFNVRISKWIRMGNQIEQRGIGSRIAMSGNGRSLVLGAPDVNDFDGEAYVYVFKRGEWTLTDTISGDAGSFDGVGGQVAFSDNGSTIAIAALADDAIEVEQFLFDTRGSVTVYRRSQEAGKFEQLGDKISGSTQASTAGAGLSLSANGNVVSFGEASLNDFSGGVFTYRYLRRKNEWQQLGDTIFGSPEVPIGLTTALSGNGRMLAIGISTETGTARIYARVGLKWIQIGQDLVGEQENDNFGSRVSFTGNGRTVAVGAPATQSLAPFPPFFPGRNATGTGQVEVWSLSGRGY